MRVPYATGVVVYTVSTDTPQEVTEGYRLYDTDAESFCAVRTVGVSTFTYNPPPVASDEGAYETPYGIFKREGESESINWAESGGRYIPK